MQTLEVEVQSQKEAVAEMSVQNYNLLIGCFILWGLALTWTIVNTINPLAVLEYKPLYLMGAYLATTFAGIAIIHGSDKPFWSFTGYNMVVVPMALLVNTVVSVYDPSIVSNAVELTSYTVILMIVLGSLAPNFFLSLGPALFMGLLSLFIAELVGRIFFGHESSIYDFVAVFIFCAYIAYDWAAANKKKRTLDNAIDSAASIYIDIINLFLRILRLLNRR